MIQQRECRSVRVPGMEVVFAVENIGQQVDWVIRDPRHVAIVHLGGRMDLLETELEGHGGSKGGALSGEVWTVPAGLGYAGRSRGDVIRYAELWISPGELQGIRPEAGAFLPGLYRGVQRLEGCLSGDACTLETEEGMHGLMDLVRKNLGRDRPISREIEGLDPGTARRIMGEVHDRIGEELSLDYLAGLAGMGCHRFLEGFRVSFGLSPWQFVIRERLRCARRMLEQTKRDITTIALAAGFSSHSHLTTAFRRHFGVTPSAYRRSRV